MKIGKSYSTPIQNTDNQVLACPLCQKDFYMLSEDFEENESVFCPNVDCGMWLVLTNQAHKQKEEEKQKRLKSLNDRRKRSTKKYQKQVAQELLQDNLFE